MIFYFQTTMKIMYFIQLQNHTGNGIRIKRINNFVFTIYFMLLSIYDGGLEK